MSDGPPLATSPGAPLHLESRSFLIPTDRADCDAVEAVAREAEDANRLIDRWVDVRFAGR